MTLRCTLIHANTLFLVPVPVPESKNVVFIISELIAVCGWVAFVAEVYLVVTKQSCRCRLVIRIV